MAKLKAVLKSEEYSDDVFLSIISNLNRAVKRREELSVWGPLKITDKSKRECFEFEQNETSNAMQTNRKRNSYMTNEVLYSQSEIKHSVVNEAHISTTLKLPNLVNEEILCKNSILNSSVDKKYDSFTKEQNSEIPRINEALGESHSEVLHESGVPYQLRHPSFSCNDLSYNREESTDIEIQYTEIGKSRNLMHDIATENERMKEPSKIQECVHSANRLSDSYLADAFTESSEIKICGNVLTTENKLSATIAPVHFKEKSVKWKICDVSALKRAKAIDKDILCENDLDKNDEQMMTACALYNHVSNYEESDAKICIQDDYKQPLINSDEDNNFDIKQYDGNTEAICHMYKMANYSHMAMEEQKNVKSQTVSNDKDVGKTSRKKQPIILSNFQDRCSRRKDKCISKTKLSESKFYSSPDIVEDAKRSSKRKKQSLLMKTDTKSKSNDSLCKDLKKAYCRKKDEHMNVYSADNVYKANGITKEKHWLCVRIIDEKDNKSCELMADFLNIARIKRMLPKLSAVIPDVDTGPKKLDYCIDAVHIILRFIINRSFSFEIMPSPVIAVEVLAATQYWEIDDLHKLFKEKFLRDVLTPKNASSIFFHASHFNLKEICDACKAVFPDNTSLNCPTYKRKQNASFVSISTHVEPLEICIPFHPIEQDFSISFDRHIINKLRFSAISSSYSITGFQVQLNEEHLKKNAENKMLKIDYSIKNISKKQEIENGRKVKPLRSINIIYFKKNLVVNRSEVGEITVEADIMPYLCSACKEIKISVKENTAECCLMMDSNFKIHSDLKLFIIGKLFYL